MYYTSEIVCSNVRGSYLVLKLLINLLQGSFIISSWLAQFSRSCTHLIINKPPMVVLHVPVPYCCVFCWSSSINLL